MIVKRLTYLFIFLLGIAACKGPQVVSFVSPGADFSQYRSYRIVPPRESGEVMQSDTSKLNSEIEELIRKEIEGRNYQHQPRSADLRIQYDFIANSKTDINITRDYTSRTAYYYAPYRVYNVNQRDFYEAILLIELKNRKAKTVWQGSLDLRYTRKLKDKSEILPSAVSKIFETFPYQAGNGEPVRTTEN